MKVVLTNIAKTEQKIQYDSFSLFLQSATLLQSMGKGSNVSHQMEYMLATGNLVSRTGLGLMQVRGQKIKQTYKYLGVYCQGKVI